MSNKTLEDAFEKLKKDGYNTVDNLVQWLRDSKIIEESEEAKQKAVKLFSEAKDKEKIELENFKKVVDALAKEQKKSVEDLTVMIAEAIPKFQQAIIAAAKAFEESMSKNK